MNSFALLGLQPDADERAIKRAYASRLRQARPDEHPERFQQLHEAYQAALDHCRARHADDHTEAITRAGPAVALHNGNPLASPNTVAIDDRPPSPPAPDLHALNRQLLHEAAAGEPSALRKWLETQPSLWSLQAKQQLGALMLAQLEAQQTPMPGECLDTLLEFFDLDHALADTNPLALQALRYRLQLAWEIMDGHRAHLAQRLYAGQSRALRRVDRSLDALTGTFSRRRAILRGLLPPVPTRMRDFIQRASAAQPEAFPPAISHPALSFWLDAGDRKRFSAARCQLGLVRSGLILAIACTLALLWVCLIWREPDRSAQLGLALIPIMLALVGIAPWLGILFAPLLIEWQARPELQAVRSPWLCMLLIPLLAGAGVILGDTLHWDGMAFGLLVAALVIAMLRFTQRNRGRRLKWGMYLARVTLLIVYPLVHLLTSSAALHLSSYIGLLAALALGLWGFDLWRHRRVLRVRTARANAPVRTR